MIRNHLDPSPRRHESCRQLDPWCSLFHQVFQPCCSGEYKHRWCFFFQAAIRQLQWTDTDDPWRYSSLAPKRSSPTMWKAPWCSFWFQQHSWEKGACLAFQHRLTISMFSCAEHHSGIWIAFHILLVYPDCIAWTQLDSTLGRVSSKDRYLLNVTWLQHSLLNKVKNSWHAAKRLYSNRCNLVW